MSYKDGFYFIPTTNRADHNSVLTNARKNAMTHIYFWQHNSRESQIAGQVGNFTLSTTFINNLTLSIPPYILQ